MKVKDIVHNKKRCGEILHVHGEQPLSEAIKVMVENDTGSVAVYSDSQFLGMITFREVLSALHRHDSCVVGLVCKDAVEKECYCATMEDSVDQLRNTMISNHIRYMPVIENGQVENIISFYDVARTVAKTIAFENRLLKQYIGNWPSDG